MSDGGAGARHAIREATLFSYLVTRQTGRAVRRGIEDQIADCPDAVVAVLDFRQVAVIDFSCADEIVAKLVHRTRSGGGPGGRFFLFRGLRDHHLDPIQSALRRRTLTVAGEREDGAPLLVGAAENPDRGAWLAVHRLERASAAEVAGELDRPISQAERLLRRLHRRGLLLAVETEYVSLARAVRDARRTSDGGG